LITAKNPGLLGRGREELTTLDDRRKTLEIPEEWIAAGASAIEVEKRMGVGLSTLQRWRTKFDGMGKAWMAAE